MNAFRSRAILKSLSLPVVRAINGVGVVPFSALDQFLCEWALLYQFNDALKQRFIIDGGVDAEFVERTLSKLLFGRSAVR